MVIKLWILTAYLIGQCYNSLCVSAIQTRQSPGKNVLSTSDSGSESNPTAMPASVAEAPSPDADISPNLPPELRVKRLMRKRKDILNTINKLQQKKQKEEKLFVRYNQIANKQMKTIMAEYPSLKERSQAAFTDLTKTFEEIERESTTTTVPESDLPRAQQVKEHRSEYDCPINCNSQYCDDDFEDQLTQCFKLHTNKKTGKKTRFCRPYEDAASLACPQDYVRCGAMSPNRKQVYEITVDPVTQSIPTTDVTITGFNLHHCTHMYLIPQTQKCDFTQLQAIQNLSLETMTAGGQTEKREPTAPKDDTKLVFKDIQLKKPGIYDVCLIEFTEAKLPNTEQYQMKIVGSGVVGTLTAATATSSVATEDNSTTENGERVPADDSAASHGDKNLTAGNGSVGEDKEPSSKSEHRNFNKKENKAENVDKGSEVSEKDNKVSEKENKDSEKENQDDDKQNPDTEKESKSSEQDSDSSEQDS